MMKRTIAILLAAAAVLALSGCKANPEFTAVVGEIYGESISLYVDEGQEFRNTTDIVEISTEGLDDIGAEVGDRVKIEHTGQMMMSLPPQVSVVKWSMVEKGVGVPELTQEAPFEIYDPGTME